MQDRGKKNPGLLVEKVTLPVGEVGAMELSVTNAVHRVAWFTATMDGAQLTVVLVLSRPGVTTVAPPNTANPATRQREVPVQPAGMGLKVKSGVVLPTSQWAVVK
jgi:hypothetical protein